MTKAASSCKYKYNKAPDSTIIMARKRGGDNSGLHESSCMLIRFEADFRAVHVIYIDRINSGPSPPEIPLVVTADSKHVVAKNDIGSRREHARLNCSERHPPSLLNRDQPAPVQNASNAWSERYRQEREGCTTITQSQHNTKSHRR